MNVSCSGGGLPESGCLFFKVTATGQNQQNSGYVTNGRNILKILFSVYYRIVLIDSPFHS